MKERRSPASSDGDVPSTDDREHKRVRRDEAPGTSEVKTAAPSSPSSSNVPAVKSNQIFLDALPCAKRYQRSLMHRDTLSHVLFTPQTHFLLTASYDGHVKFWKKLEQGIEFVKDYRAHLAPIVDLCCSSDGSLAASVGSDGTVKIFDVVNFDLINMITLPYTPRACCWVHKRGVAQAVLAISQEDSATIRMYDGRGQGEVLRVAEKVHRSPCHLLAYNEVYDCIVSADVDGMIEYWSPEEPYELPKGRGLWEFKSKTDLFSFKKAKSVMTSLRFSNDYRKFVTFSAFDRKIRIFHFATGKLLKQYDESIQLVQERQVEIEEARKSGASDGDVHANASAQSMFHLDSMEFGRRLAVERELDTSVSTDTLKSGLRSRSGGCSANVLFDESGRYIVYATMFGIQQRDTSTDRVDVLLGKDESVRFLDVCLFQGAVKSRKSQSLALIASENPILAAQKDLADPTIVATAFKRSRFYIFTREEPDNDTSAKSGSDRDIFNEKPTREEQTLAAATATASNANGRKSNAVSTAVLHTTEGDITLRLFPQLVPKTVENFVGLARKHYYDGVIFHRVIKKFMLQTGDPLGDGTGGESLWGHEFEDEFTRQLRHDRPYVLSMANAGPNTNGSQFFITTVPTPWLDDKHTIFGRATAGFDVIHTIENARVNRNTDMPEKEISILNITLEYE